MIGHPDLDVFWAAPGSGSAHTFRCLEAPLRMPWKQAWKVLPSWRVLHRVASVSRVLDPEEYDGDPVRVVGWTCCGRRGELEMPGLLSRLALPRCKVCCKAAEIEPGDGMPGNGPDCGPMDAWQVR